MPPACFHVCFPLLRTSCLLLLASRAMTSMESAKVARPLNVGLGRMERLLKGRKVKSLRAGDVLRALDRLVCS